MPKQILNLMGLHLKPKGYPIGRNECFKEHNLLRANETYTQKTKWKFTTC